LQETNSFPGGKEAESVIKKISDFSINKAFFMRTCLANSFVIGNFSLIFMQDSGDVMFGLDDVLPL
jgi:hypothetical protein